MSSVGCFSLKCNLTHHVLQAMDICLAYKSEKKCASVDALIHLHFIRQSDEWKLQHWNVQKLVMRAQVAYMTWMPFSQHLIKQLCISIDAQAVGQLVRESMSVFYLIDMLMERFLTLYTKWSLKMAVKPHELNQFT